MTHWPGISWREIEHEWTDSQFWMFVARLNERLDREREEIERARNGGKPKSPIDAFWDKWQTVN